jgi:small conductance mechanosensitive channel
VAQFFGYRSYLNAFMDINKLYDKFYTWLVVVGPRVVIAILFLVIGWWIINTILKWINNILTRRKIDPSVQPFLSSIIGILFKVLLLLSCIQIVGLQLTVFTTLIGAFGVAAGLALSGTLQNFTSGIIILLLKPFKVGEIIMAQGQEGKVTVIRIFHTILTTLDNQTVIIPNSKLSNEVIINLSRQGKRRLRIEVKFGFQISFEDVKKSIEQTIHDNAGLLKDPAHSIGVSVIESDGYKVEANVWLRADNYQILKLELQERMVDNLKHAGIKLPGMP